MNADAEYRDPDASLSSGQRRLKGALFILVGIALIVGGYFLGAFLCRITHYPTSAFFLVSGAGFIMFAMGTYSVGVDTFPVMRKKTRFGSIVRVIYTLTWGVLVFAFIFGYLLYAGIVK